MKFPIRTFGLVFAAGAAALIASAPAQAAAADGGQAVFVQTNDPAANAIAAFHRNGDGTLTFAASYPTGGRGSRQTSSMSDPLASQGSLVRLPQAGLLLAVNAGSSTISVFHVDGDRLALAQVLPSGGPFPTSFAVHGNLVYVLDAGGSGFVSGYRVTGGSLQPIAGSTRTLGLANSTPPFFLSSPAEVGFSPGGGQLIVTTKTNGTVDVFSVGDGGRLSATPVKNAAAGVPFAFVFDGQGRLILNFAGSSSLEIFRLNADGTITPVSTPAGDGQAALCWITGARGFDYTSNTGSNDVSQFRVVGDTVSVVNPVAASNIPGAIDSDEVGGSFLYVLGGLDRSIHVFAIGPGGTLSGLQVVAVPGGASQEGISAS